MPIFYFKAKNKTAQTISGKIEALNREEAIEIINHRGLVPVSISEGELGSTANPRFRSRKIKNKQLFLFSRNLANLIKAGIPILRALSLIQEQTSDVYFRHVLSTIHGRIKDGKSFSECLAEYPKIFNSLYVTMIRAGEQGGRLKEMLSRLSDHLKAQEELLSKIRSAVAYPILMALVGIGTVIFILTFVMPKISGLFSNMNMQLPLATKILMNISHFLREGWIVLCVVLLTVILIVKKWYQTRKGKMIVSRIKLQLPFLRNFFIRVELSRFSRTLALLLKSGIPLIKALDITIPILDNDFIKENLSQCRKNLELGSSLAESLKETKIVPPLMISVISVGEESGLLEGTLDEMADSYEQETNEVIKTMTTLLEPLMILGVGLIVGAVVIAMLLPIFQIDILAQ